MSQTQSMAHEEVSGASEVLSCGQQHFILLWSGQIHAKRLLQKNGLWQGREGDDLQGINVAIVWTVIVSQRPKS